MTPDERAQRIRITFDATRPDGKQWFVAFRRLGKFAVRSFATEDQARDYVQRERDLGSR